MPFDPLLFAQNTVILPEIIVIVCLLIVLVLDLIQENSAWLSTISLTGLVAATIALVFQWNHPSANDFLGSIQVDNFTISFRGIITISSALSILISTEYIKRAGMGLAECLIFILTATVGGLFLCGANNLVTVFVSLECLSLSSYLLVGYAKKDVRSNEASMKYLLMGGASSSIIAYGFSWLYGLSGGEIELSKLVDGITNHIDEPIAVWVALACVVVGIGFKLSAFPFHQWTPDVYEGSPTPVVAFFSVGSKAAALALATRMLSIVFPSIESEWHVLLELLALLSMIFGNLIAATQTSMKRMLAYSSISQAGYLIIGIVCGNIYGYTGMITYMVTYIFMNLGAFGCVILFGLRTGTDQIRDYTGLYLKDPLLAFCLSVCLLSLAGIPPLAGFFGKLYLFWCGWKSGLYLLVYVALITSVISMYYYLRVVKSMFTRETKEQSSYVRNYLAPSLSLLPTTSIEVGIALCVFISTTLGFVINPIISATSETLLATNTIVG
uniref:NAD(P)H-quinone oxidoreductase subunit 2, chloroplastic n=1 Tax=Zygnema circumcarinatum TaxID=35869 RepID=NU2C_ZYGCR|nr:subunit 2 of NADH-plastoquinone oxidoreductase [Zygnema circumcarinatum]Q32RP6.1 RecName: Full=NAD(P)H-quinone oxidoreductase subunit 2, chloroplastic; AltName: Full=NAD(P)H dehydrogenase, subunit 2; AltName: Full=NADH-plastoquinone oxidoreductase subunit 2 [Zygnema circumcarinatum]AAX45813.1 subunit 2 of NADH-plastoquinone oxidoreductase [Zygnema circumcarinatum]